MSNKISAILLLLLCLSLPAAAQKNCFTSEARAEAERTAKVFQAPDPDYDPVLGYSPAKGPRAGAPTVDSAGRAAAITCVASKKENEGTGTTPKFYCSVAGVVDENGEPVRYKIKPQFKGQQPADSSKAGAEEWRKFYWT